VSKKRLPQTKIIVAPGEDIWSAAARELASNPDSPASLHLMSAVKHAMAPRSAAIAQLVEAIEAQLNSPGVAADTAVQSAIGYWERTCEAVLDATTLASFQEDARKRLERRRNQPPDMSAVLKSRPAGTDTGYTLGVHLDGIQGTWHRLWASVALAYSFDDDPDVATTCVVVRKQFEAALGRPLAPEEWDGLKKHAHQHYLTVIKPKYS